MQKPIRVVLLLIAGIFLVTSGLLACQQQGKASAGQPAGKTQPVTGAAKTPTAGLAADFTLEQGGEVPGGKSISYPAEHATGFDNPRETSGHEGCGDHVIESYRFKDRPSLIALDLAGNELWTLDPPGRGLHNGVSLTVDNQLLLYDGERSVHLVSPEGDLLWTYAAKQPEGWKELTQEILDDHDGWGMPDEFMDRATIWHPGGANCTAAVAANDGGVLVLSAAELVKLDGDGQAVWAIDSPPFNTALFYQADDGCILVTEEQRPGASGAAEYRAKGRMMSRPEIEERHLNSRMTVTFVSPAGEVVGAYETFTPFLHTTSSLFEGLNLVTPTSFGSVFVDTDSSLVAFGNAGEELWRYDLPRMVGQEDRQDHYGFQQVFSLAADENTGNIVLATRCNNLYILDSSGELIATSKLPAGSRNNSSCAGPQGPSLVLDDQGNIFGCHESEGFDGAVIWAMDPLGEILWEQQQSTSGYVDGPVLAPDGTVHFAMGLMEMSDSGRRRWGERLLAYWPNGELCYERLFLDGTSTSFPPEFAKGSRAYLLTFNQTAGRLVFLPDLSPVWECDGQELAVAPGSLLRHPDGLLLFICGEVEWYHDHCM